MTEKKKTVCVGRFLIDVPMEAEVRLSRERIAGFEIETTKESSAEFRERIMAKQKEIEMRGANSRKNGEGG